MARTNTTTTFATFNESAINQIVDYSAKQNGTGIFAHSLNQLRAETDALLQEPLDVPGQGEAGSYEHNKHKSNYELMDACAKLYLFDGSQQYRDTILSLLLAYAERYLDMPFHEQKNTNPPGRLFHQILNEHMWLCYASLAYNAIQDSLSEADQRTIEDRLFKPMIEMFTVLYGHDFDRIHNHGIWAVAAVGICAIVVGDKETVHKSIYGMAGDGETGGFLAQIAQLFSASGYYIEGPYYHRFAIRPLCFFAEAIHEHYPEVDIYNYKQQVVGRTIMALITTSNPDGTFPALNDSSRTMNIDDEGAKAAMSVYFARYGEDEKLTATVKSQGTVWLSPCSLALCKAVDAYQGEASVRWASVDLQEGDAGERGAQGFLRSKNPAKPVSQAIMAYGQHGMGHGHFDALGIILFADGHEYLREYGYGRWVNVETKFGGRYLDENKTWARQTIAHNTVTVDELCQNNFDHQLADTHFGRGHFFLTDGNIQAMSAFANEHYDGVKMQRSVLLLELDDFEQPLVLDLYKLDSDTEHQYDYAVHYKGQITNTSFDYTSSLTERKALGKANGYQHLLEKARGKTTDKTVVTWLQDQRFHSWVTSAEQGEVIFAQTGANDPSMNLRSEDCFILRQTGSKHLFAATYETHGLFDEGSERCFGAYGQVEAVTVLAHSDEASIVKVSYKAAGTLKALTVCVSNDETKDQNSSHSVSVGNETYSWTGYINTTITTEG
ncbi:heparinase II/III domain-containing protein [Reinekea thalattae]|uniref:Alginate lyase family protein n=1 Tax=Reinekea thalattae TaxID=2593301 RepID=A0A5C8Z283_9GAMM|nr:heparinase II/III family protein [Reinekea thalattae]TXR51359.1 alginate lyase family protein [Reinekea thalattae]